MEYQEGRSLVSYAEQRLVEPKVGEVLRFHRTEIKSLCLGLNAERGFVA